MMKKTNNQNIRCSFPASSCFMETSHLTMDHPEQVVGTEILPQHNLSHLLTLSLQCRQRAVTTWSFSLSVS